jgi:hypothetical protein
MDNKRLKNMSSKPGCCEVYINKPCPHKGSFNGYKGKI